MYKCMYICFFDSLSLCHCTFHRSESCFLSLGQSSRTLSGRSSFTDPQDFEKGTSLQPGIHQL